MPKSRSNEDLGRSNQQPQQLLASIRKQFGGNRRPQLDERNWATLKEQALKKAADLQQKASQSAKEGVEGARLVVADLARGDAKQAGTRVGAAVERAGDSAFLMGISRLMICMYFINTVYDRYGSYQFTQQPEVLERAKRWPQHYPVISFPYLSVGMLLPCAVLAALGIKVLFCAWFMVAWEVFDSLNLLMMLLFSGVKPNELVVKRLAMMGCTALVLAHSMKEQRVQISSYAGLLLSGNSRKRQPSRAKSLVLLLGRLLMALLFIYLERVIARDFILVNHLPHSQLPPTDAAAVDTAVREGQQRDELIAACEAALGRTVQRPSGPAVCAEACSTRALILFNVFALEGFHIAEALGVPCLAASPCLVPYAMPAAFERRFRQANPSLYQALKAADEHRQQPVAGANSSAANIGSTGIAGSVGWAEVRHWLWPLFTERWGAWRHHRLGLPAVPYSDCPPGVPLPPAPALLYGVSESVVPRPGFWPSTVHMRLAASVRGLQLPA
ncbi:hypothetical protein CHLNCDRAFT_145146 [Chlorella variabilis]|uniref:Uncharacterized protein n=1 Tax=Chlorella variabilis TaxID=554065 RepID=E1ZCP7_CHLVA|nr:hypothetical protein CHLNCDRAFT_145146 [Chlorella variabilis]EFN56472.1 hypothetical protein CHLNCDRAFT_145146 [Chlorella variabilis]|eukprot:XP_005848574.1 hypothetical protein CHLNCDRAFT_145146 [Chlorella variabilis]